MAWLKRKKRALEFLRKLESRIDDVVETLETITETIAYARELRKLGAGAVKAEAYRLKVKYTNKRATVKKLIKAFDKSN